MSDAKIVIGTDGNETYFFSNSQSLEVSAGGGNDNIYVYKEVRAYAVLDGGEGNDNISDLSSSDILIFGGGGRDRIDARQQYAENTLRIKAGDGDDIITVHERLMSEVPPVAYGYVEGGAGADTINVEGAGCNIDGGEGDDVIALHADGAILSFGYGDGVDRLAIYAETLQRLHFKRGVLPDTVTVRQQQDGYYAIELAGGEDRIVILNSGDHLPLNHPDAPSQIEKITFEELPGVVWSWSDLVKTITPPANDTSELLQGFDHLFDFIEGFGGNDTLQGLSGNDTLVGGEGQDILEGGSGDDRLEGGDGADVLKGDAGGDAMLGGGGDDAYYVDNSLDMVIEKAGEGQDEVYSSISYLLPASVEYGELTGTANINLTGHNQGAQLWGNAGSNRITGGTGADELSGNFGGVDTLVGGDADDLYYILNKTDVVIEKANEGFDEAWSMVSGYKLAENIESLKMLSNTAVGYGNEGDNGVWGNGARNAIYGMGGDDFIMAYSGDDTIAGGRGQDILSGGAGNDTYIYNPGDGYDEIYNFDSKGADTLLIHGVTESQLWFTRSGKGLTISVIGKEDSVGVNNWYAGSAYQVDLIKLDNGKTLSAGSVANLVNAMSAFTPPALGQTTLPVNYQAALSSTIAQNWVA
ncbi:MAG: calcium-binding protein [Aquabacterium sp.]